MNSHHKYMIKTLQVQRKKMQTFNVNIRLLRMKLEAIFQIIITIILFTVAFNTILHAYYFEHWFCY